MTIMKKVRLSDNCVLLTDNCLLRVFGLLVLVCLIGCSFQARELIVPTTSAIVKQIQVYPLFVNPGATVVLNIELVSPSDNFPGGEVIINDSSGNSYRGNLSHAKKSSRSDLVTSITLSPLVPSGELLLQVFVLDLAGNPSNTGVVKITVL